MTSTIPVFGPSPAIIIPTETDKAYAAGFFDGEGNITIAVNWNGGTDNRYRVYNMRIGASQNDVSVLFWFRDRWGGTVRQIKRNTPHRAHEWQCFSRQALRCLSDFLPYLHVKRERAELAIQVQSSITRFGRGGRPKEFLGYLSAIIPSGQVTQDDVRFCASGAK